MRILLGAVLIVLAGWLGAVVIVRHSIAQPPPLPADVSILKLKPVVRDGKTWLGQSWAGSREGLPVVFLKGSPLEIGFADGALMQEKMHTLENEFLKMIQGYVPVSYTHLSANLPPDEIDFVGRQICGFQRAANRLREARTVARPVSYTHLR